MCLVKPINVVKPSYHALVGQGKRRVGNADLRSLHKLTSTNPKGKLAT